MKKIIKFKNVKTVKNVKKFIILKLLFRIKYIQL